MDSVRQALLDGRGEVPRLGMVRAGSTGSLPFLVVDEAGVEVEPFTVFLRDLMLTDMSPLTARSYGNDLLRWWRLLRVLGVRWDHATRDEVEVLVGWMRSADNPQRHRRRPDSSAAGSVNRRTGKQALSQGYAPATINHTLSVLGSFYAFHAQFGRGPVVNPVPTSASRRARLAHRSPIEAQAEHRQAQVNDQIRLCVDLCTHPAPKGQHGKRPHQPKEQRCACRESEQPRRGAAAGRFPEKPHISLIQPQVCGGGK